MQDTIQRTIHSSALEFLAKKLLFADYNFIIIFQSLYNCKDSETIQVTTDALTDLGMVQWVAIVAGKF